LAKGAGSKARLRVLEEKRRRSKESSGNNKGVQNAGAASLACGDLKRRKENS